MLGFLIGCVWLVIFRYILLNINNPIKRILHKLRLKNNMSDDLLDESCYGEGDFDEATMHKLI